MINPLWLLVFLAESRDPSAALAESLNISKPRDSSALARE